MKKGGQMPYRCRTRGLLAMFVRGERPAWVLQARLNAASDA